MTSFLKSLGGYFAGVGAGVYNWTTNKIKTTASGFTESTINIVLDKIPYLKKGSKFSLRKDNDSVITLENLELALDKTNETLASLHLPLVVTTASLGQVGVEKDEKHYVIVVSTLDLSLDLGAKTQEPPKPSSTNTQNQSSQQQTQIAGNTSHKIESDGQDYSDIDDEIQESSTIKDLSDSLSQFRRNLEAKIEKINITIRDPSTSSSIKLHLGMVCFNGTTSSTSNKRVSTIKIGKITLESGDSMIFSFEPGADDSISITQKISNDNPNNTEKSIFDEIFSFEQISKIDINFSNTKVHAKIGIDQVHTMTELILAFVNVLIVSNEQEREAKLKKIESNIPQFDESTESFYDMTKSNSNLHNSAFGKKVDFFKEINHKEITDSSDFNVCFNEICLEILAAQNSGDHETKDALRLGLKQVVFKMDSGTGLINASLGTITGEIIRKDAESLKVFEFIKNTSSEKDLTLYLSTDTNLNLIDKSSIEKKAKKQTQGYLIKLDIVNRIDINFDPKILEILFVNKLIDLTSLAKKSEAGPDTVIVEQESKVPQKPVHNFGLRLSITMNCALKIRLKVPMMTVIPRENTKERETTVGYMFIHNLIKDYLWEESCIFDIEASSLSFLSVSTQGAYNSSTMGIGFDTLKVQLHRKDSARIVFESKSKKSNTNQAYPILLTSTGNGKHVVTVNNSLNTKTSSAFDYLNPGNIYTDYTKEHVNDAEFSLNFNNINHSVIFNMANEKSDCEEIEIINNTYDFNTIFKDPYLIYGNIPKNDAKTLNWNYYSSKCVNIIIIIILFT